MRKREEHFGWGKTIGRIRQTLYRGIRRVDQHFKLTMTASNAMAPLRGLKKSFLRQSDPPQTKIHPTNPLEVPYFNSLLGRLRHAMNPLPGFDARQRVAGKSPEGDSLNRPGSDEICCGDFPCGVDTGQHDQRVSCIDGAAVVFIDHRPGVA